MDCYSPWRGCSRPSGAGGGFPIVLTIAYLANRFPSPVEPYVGRKSRNCGGGGSASSRGVCGRQGDGRRSGPNNGTAEVVLQSLSVMVLLRAAWLCMRRWRRISDPDPARDLPGPRRRRCSGPKALLHTWLGACYAVLLEPRGVEHIHVHHGYFGSWIAMVAGRLMDVGFSMTLHGSDLLLHGTLLNVKLRELRVVPDRVRVQPALHSRALSWRQS